tara:strand:+ start:186 stop:569 length:384 start_codon:yes stop_codon:yes gene_type:complete
VKQKLCDAPEWFYHTTTYTVDDWTQTLINMEKKMAYKHQPGRGSLFRNESTNPKAPLWSGSIEIPEGAGGQTMDIAAWYNEAYTDKDGVSRKEKFSLGLSEPWNKESQPSTYQPAVTSTADKDDIPF